MSDIGPSWSRSAETLIRSATGVKLGPGVLGMMAPVNISGLVAIALIAIFFRGNVPLTLIAIVCVAGLLVYLNERAFRYATKNPIPALLGGAELLQLFREQMSARDKSIVAQNQTPIAAGSQNLIEPIDGDPNA